MPVRPIYRASPVYHPDHEPSGYLERLARAEPEIVWDSSKRPPLETDEDWIRAGELVYDSARSYTSGGFWVGPLSERDWIRRYRVPSAKDGTIPFFHYIVRERGVVEFGVVACAHCHTRVLPDGSVVKGTQGNFPAAQLHGDVFRRTSDQGANGELVTSERAAQYRYHGAPWLADDPNAKLATLSSTDFIDTYARIPPGVYPNHNGSIFYPVRIAHLIGLKNRRYLDSTGHHRHRGPSDVMRFSDFHQLGSYYASFGDEEVPAVAPPDPATVARYSDEQLYALTRYLYSLKPPANPNLGEEPAARGKTVFERSGCPSCHAPPDYTNDKLTPADGFAVPPDHPERAFVDPRPVHTDPHLAMKTRKGTGFYKVPTLRGLWFRGPFGHTGSVLTLEEWFDPRRLSPDHVPSGWTGPTGATAPGVQGHVFGTELSPEDRRDLIAFLRTL